MKCADTGVPSGKRKCHLKQNCVQYVLTYTRPQVEATGVKQGCMLEGEITKQYIEIKIVVFLGQIMIVF